MLDRPVTGRTAARHGWLTGSASSTASAPSTSRATPARWAAIRARCPRPPDPAGPGLHRRGAGQCHVRGGGGEDGTRNVTLNNEAWGLFSRFSPAGLLDVEDITEAMRDAAAACGLYGDAVERTIASAIKGGDQKNRSTSCPTGCSRSRSRSRSRVRSCPASNRAFYAHEKFFDLCKSADGFYARPRGTGTPAIVIEIGDDMQRAVMLWWRRAAESWNAKRDQAAKDAADEAAEAFEAGLEAMDPLAQLEVLKKRFLGKRSKDDDDDDDRKSRAEVLPAMDKFTRIVEHLQASATQHLPVELHLRAVDGPGYVVVDLADETGRVVLITESGWEITDVRSVQGSPWFKRNSTMLAQVTPVAPADVRQTLDEAREVLGVNAGQWAIVLAGLIGAYFPSIDRPGWWLTGPSGAGKTTRGRMITGWVDPMNHLGGRINLRRDERNARAKAMNSFVFTIDNATSITQEESDFWCAMITGASDQARKLHSDNTMLSFEYRRIGLGTSLNLPTGFKPDALRRTLHVQLEGSGDHPDLEGLWKDYNADQAAGDGRHLHRDRRDPGVPGQGAGREAGRHPRDERFRPAAEGGRPGLPQAGARHRAGWRGPDAVRGVPAAHHRDHGRRGPGEPAGAHSPEGDGRQGGRRVVHLPARRAADLPPAGGGGLRHHRAVVPGQREAARPPDNRPARRAATAWASPWSAAPARAGTCPTCSPRWPAGWRHSQPRPQLAALPEQLTASPTKS